MVVVLAALAAVLIVGAVAWLVVYVVKEATTLKATTESLQHQLTQFKEGGFDKLVSEKLTVLVQTAAKELQAREQLIEQGHSELINQQRRASEAAEQFKKDLGSVTTQISQLSELGDKVGELNDLLKPQQLRGELGEVIVRALIADKLPRGHYEEEFTFADGKKVEFVIRLNDRLIPVDSKLQLEDFRRLRDADERQRPSHRTEFKRKVKQKIDEVKGYIRPEEGTWNFALMVIPSEAVYYELIGEKDFVEEGGLYDYARAQNVFLASPLTFWAYLTVIAQGLRGLEIGHRAEEILSGLQTLAGKIRHFSQDEFQTLGMHLRNATNKYDEALRKLRDVEDGLTTMERVESDQLTERGAGL